jgi:hypothetical protein
MSRSHVHKSSDSFKYGAPEFAQFVWPDCVTNNLKRHVAWTTNSAALWMVLYLPFKINVIWRLPSFVCVPIIRASSSIKFNLRKCPKLCLTCVFVRRLIIVFQGLFVRSMHTQLRRIIHMDLVAGMIACKDVAFGFHLFVILDFLLGTLFLKTFEVCTFSVFNVWGLEKWKS